MSIMIDEVLSDIDIPAGNTGENEPDRSGKPGPRAFGPSAYGADFMLRDAIIRLEKRELRLMAD
jgi:hypothetical protein